MSKLNADYLVVLLTNWQYCRLSGGTAGYLQYYWLSGSTAGYLAVLSGSTDNCLEVLLTIWQYC